MSLPPPFIVIPTIPNLRSLPLPPSPKPPAIYRSASPYPLTPSALSALQHGLHITHIFDLRSTPEIAKSLAVDPSVLDSPIPRTHVPVFTDAEYSPEAIALRFKDYASVEDGEAGFVRAYAEILKHAGPAYRTMLLHLAALPPDEAILIHCTAGKDRTGLFAALVLGLLGWRDEEICQEYALSEAGLEGWREGAVERLMGMEVMQGVGREGVKRMVGAREGSMKGALEMMRREWGGWEEYVEGVCRVSGEEVMAVRRRLGGGKSSV